MKAETGWNPCPTPSATENEKNTILFAGYQANGTLGRIIFDGAKSVKIFGEEIDVKAEITLLQGISGHADQQGLQKWLESAKNRPKYVFVNHGDEDSCTGFSKLVTETCGIPAMAPFSGSEFDLLKGEWIRLTDPVYRKKENAAAAAAPKSKGKDSPYRDLMEAVKAPKSYAETLQGASNGEIRKLIGKIRDLIGD